MLSRLSLAAFVATVFVAGAAPALAEQAVQASKPPAAAPVPDPVAIGRWDPTGWTKLGSRVLSAKRTTDLIMLGAIDGRVDQLTLVVDGELDVSGVTVVTAGARRIARAVPHHFWASARTQLVELRGNDRALRSIAVNYKLAADAVATVTVYGRDSTRVRAEVPTEIATASDRPAESGGFVKVVADPGASTEPVVSVRQGWTLLGAQTVEGTNDADVIRVPKSVIGMFTQVALVVAGGSLDVAELRLRFAGGQSAAINAAFSFHGDERTRVIAVPGSADGNIIRLIQLRYGTDRGAGKTRVEVWAR